VVDPVGVISGQGVADEQSGVAANHGEPLVAERVHQRHKVVCDGCGVVAVPGLVGQPHTTLIDRDHLEVLGQRRHH